MAGAVQALTRFTGEASHGTASNRVALARAGTGSAAWPALTRSIITCVSSLDSDAQERVTVITMRWEDHPVWVPCVAAAYVIGFLEGTGVHAYLLATRGLHAYSYAPVPVQMLFHGLLLLDPLVALLNILASPGGPLLAAVVMLGDLVGNWAVAWNALWTHPVALVRPVGLLPITFFGVFILITAPPLWRTLTSRG